MEILEEFPGGSREFTQLVKKSACSVGGLGSIPGLGRASGEGNGLPSSGEFWPGEFHGLYSPWGPKEWGMGERLSLAR